MRLQVTVSMYMMQPPFLSCNALMRLHDFTKLTPHHVKTDKLSGLTFRCGMCVETSEIIVIRCIGTPPALPSLRALYEG